RSSPRSRSAPPARAAASLSSCRALAACIPRFARRLVQNLGANRSAPPYGLPTRRARQTAEFMVSTSLPRNEERRTRRLRQLVAAVTKSLRITPGLPNLVG